MLDPVLAQQLWRERDRDLTRRAERERQLRDGQLPPMRLRDRMRMATGLALLTLGSRLTNQAAPLDTRALRQSRRWALDRAGALPRNSRAYTLIYSQSLTMGSGRNAGVMLLSLTWLPASQSASLP
jgi:hypothetical protein